VGGEVKIIGSANDRAEFPEDVMELREWLSDASVVWTDHVNRNDDRVQFGTLPRGALLEHCGWYYFKGAEDKAIREDGEADRVHPEAMVFPLKCYLKD
jgi:hypothetical protein